MSLKMSTIDKGIENQWVASSHGYLVCFCQFFVLFCLFMMVINGQEERERRKKKKETHFDISFGFFFFLLLLLYRAVLCRFSIIHQPYEQIRFFSNFFLVFLVAEWNDIYVRTTSTTTTTTNTNTSHCTFERRNIARRDRERKNFNLSLSFPLLAISAREREKKKKNVKPNKAYKTHHSFCQIILEQKPRETERDTHLIERK